MPRRLLRAFVLLAGGAVLGMALVAALIVVAAAAAGVLTAPPGAWVVRVEPVPGIALKASVPGLARFATAPAALRLLDGRVLATRFGRLRFERDGASLLVTCAPCRIDEPGLAPRPLHIEGVRLRLAPGEAQTLRGELGAEGVVLRFAAKLQPEFVDLDWQLPPTDIAAVYRLLSDAIPESQAARIDGLVAARGSLRLPQRRARVELSLDGFAVDGLGTESLAAGPVAFSCRDARGVPRPRRVVPGEGRWISPSQSGALLAAAVLAAEDQRFGEHEGFDRAEIDRVLSSIDEQGPTRGASTITQQLARTLFTGGERTAARKLRELLYAVEMERTLGKRAILALYLNTVDWGPGICGADDAARVYFGKRPQRLSPLEAAWLAAILPNPAQAYEHEFLAGSADTGRAVRVLRQMRSLPRAERERWAERELAFVTPPAAAPEREPRLAAAAD